MRSMTLRPQPTYRDALWLAGLLKAAERDYTRADDGKFSETSGGGGGGAKAEPKAKAKDTRTTQEKANQNRAQVAEQTGLGSDLDGAMARLNAGMGGQADGEKADQLVERGLAQKDPNTGRYSLSPEGKAYYRAAKQGDADAARVAMGDAKDRQAGAKAKAEERSAKTTARESAAAERKAKTEAAAAERKQKAAEREKAKAEKKPKGGGKSKPSEEDKAKAKEEATTRRKEEQAQAKESATRAAAERAGVPPADLDAMRGAADGAPVTDESASRLLASGLMERGEGGAYQLTREGQAALRSLEQGNSRGVVAARQQAQRKAAPKATTKAATWRDAVWIGRALPHAALAKRASVPTATFARFDLDALAKSGADERLVYGIASTAELDAQPGIWEGQRYDGDVVDASAIQDALTDYLAWANIREMHAAKAVGVAIHAEVQDGALHLAAQIEDEGAWAKVKAGVYKGFSIGGKVLKAALERLPDGRLIRRITKLLLTEISLVDRPANPAARILLFKGADMSDEETVDERAPLDLAALLELAKAAPDPMKATTQLQAIRDELELSGDVQGAGLMSQAISLVLQAAGEAEAPAEDAEVEETEEVTDDVEMAEDVTEDDPAALAMAARATIRKASRLRMGKRLPGMESIAKSILQLCADAGSESATRALKAYGAEAAVGKSLTEGDVSKLLDAALTKALAPVAAGVLNTHQRLTEVEKQPAGGGPITRMAGQSITKRLGDETHTASAPDPATLARLRQLAATESNPARREQYQTQLKQLEAAQR